MAQVSAQGKRHVFVYDTQDVVDIKLASFIFDLYKKNVAAKDRFTVVVSGQAEAKALGTLARSNNCVDCSKWYVFFADEKVVPLNNPESNYKVNYDHFLSKVSIPKHQIYHINYSPSAQGVAEDYSDQINRAWSDRIIDLDDTGFPKFDLILLGMGPDGHFAALFPLYPQLDNDTDWVTYLTNAPHKPHPRITLTFPVFDCATNIAMVALGLGQAPAVAESIKGPLPRAIPTGRLQGEARGDMAWFLDKAAASLLGPHN